MHRPETRKGNESFMQQTKSIKTTTYNYMENKWNNVVPTTSAICGV
jgi:hypothetical protein